MKRWCCGLFKYAEYRAATAAHSRVQRASCVKLFLNGGENGMLCKYGLLKIIHQCSTPLGNGLLNNSF